MLLQTDLISNGLAALMLVFIRMTGLFVVAPIFGRRNIPTYYKIGFSFILAIIMVNVVDLKGMTNFDNFISFGGSAAREFLVGLCIGYISYLVFSGIYLAGQLIDMQIGFGMVSVLDPMSNIQMPVTSNIYYMVSMLVFLSINGHHYLISALYQSYSFVPINGAVFTESLTADIIRITGESLAISFRIAAPIIGAILITDIALGVISKSVPQLNVFVVGMPLKIVMGLLVIVLVIPMFVSYVPYLNDKMTEEVTRFLTDMGPFK